MKCPFVFRNGVTAQRNATQRNGGDDGDAV